MCDRDNVRPESPWQFGDFLPGQLIGLLASAALAAGSFAPAAIALPFQYVAWIDGKNGPGVAMIAIAMVLASGSMLGSRIMVNIAAMAATLVFGAVLYMIYHPYSDLQWLLWGLGLMGSNLIGAIALEWGTWVIALGVLLALIASTCKMR
jgi:hypothetical protein